MAKRIMRKFRITEISGVDRPAQEGAKVLIMKRDSMEKADQECPRCGGVGPDACRCRYGKSSASDRSIDLDLPNDTSNPRDPSWDRGGSDPLDQNASALDAKREILMAGVLRRSGRDPLPGKSASESVRHYMHQQNDAAVIAAFRRLDNVKKNELDPNRPVGDSVELCKIHLDHLRREHASAIGERRAELEKSLARSEEIVADMVSKRDAEDLAKLAEPAETIEKKGPGKLDFLSKEQLDAKLMSRAMKKRVRVNGKLEDVHAAADRLMREGDRKSLAIIAKLKELESADEEPDEDDLQKAESFAKKEELDAELLKMVRLEKRNDGKDTEADAELRLFTQDSRLARLYRQTYRAYTDESR